MEVEIRDTVMFVCNKNSSAADLVSFVLQRDVFPEAKVLQGPTSNTADPGVKIVRLESKSEVERFMERNRARLVGVLVEEDLNLGDGTEIARAAAASGLTVSLLTVEKYVTTPAVTEGGIDILTPLEVPGVRVVEISEGFRERIIAFFKEIVRPGNSA